MPAAASRALRRLAAKKWEGENPLTSSVHNRDRVSCPTGMDNNGLGGTPRHQAATITWLSFGRADADIIVTHIRRTRLEHEGAGAEAGAAVKCHKAGWNRSLVYDVSILNSTSRQKDSSIKAREVVLRWRATRRLRVHSGRRATY